MHLPQIRGGSVEPPAGLIDHEDSNKLEVVIAFASKDFLAIALPCGPQISSWKGVH